MSTRYDTIGIVLASGNGTLTNGRPSVLAEIDGTTILQRAIDAHLAAFGQAIVVLDAVHGRKIRETIGNNSVIWCVQSDECPKEDALKCALFELHRLDIYPDNVVISMGNAGLWRPETLRAVHDVHRATRTERALVITMATARWSTHREGFWDYGLIVYSGRNDPLPGQAKRVLEYWQYGPGRNGQVGISGGDVSAKLFCVDFAWLLDCVERYSTQYQDRNLPAECFLHRLVSVAYEQRQPAALYRLPDAQAHEALSIGHDYDLEYVEGILHARSSLAPDDAWDAGMKFAAEYAAAARATA